MKTSRWRRLPRPRSNTGTLFDGDSLKTLVFMEAFTDPKAVTLSGQKLQYTLTISMGTG